MQPPQRPCLLCGKPHWGPCRPIRNQEIVAPARNETPPAKVPAVVVESIAPPGVCKWCDRRRAINAASAIKRRRKKRGEPPIP